jgi:hypothetical protein
MECVKKPEYRVKQGKNTAAILNRYDEVVWQAIGPNAGNRASIKAGILNDAVASFLKNSSYDIKRIVHDHAIRGDHDVLEFVFDNGVVVKIHMPETPKEN